MFTIYNKNYKKHSGNITTINRLKNLINITESNIITNNIIGINAYLFGKQLINSDINYIIILSGTDINVDINDSFKFNIIQTTLKKAKYIVSFNNYMIDIICSKFNLNTNKIKLIKQGIPKNLKSYYYNLRCRLRIPSYIKIYVQIGNLRPIKRPDYLFNYFSHSKNSVLVLIGNIYEMDYFFPDNIYHINGLEKQGVYSCIEEADGLINTSVSEGMSSSILEAMVLQTPVYAFKNKGNMSIIKDNYNGYLFESVKIFKFIITLPIEKIIKKAREYVHMHHSIINEKHLYNALIRN